MEKEYFWSIAVEDGFVQAAIWTIVDGAAKIIDVSNKSAWENDETLISAADVCLSKCIADLPETAPEPSKTVFGVPSFWVTDGQIERQYLDKIKLLCDKLSLTPTGFVVVPEAIAHFEKAQEKTPINAVLIGIYPQTIDVSLFRLGNIVGSVNVSRSPNIVEDATEALVRFGVQDPFPSRFLIYGLAENDLEEIKQSLIKADWDHVHEKIQFLHTPQIEIFTSENKMAALCLAGAVEMGSATGISTTSVKEETFEAKEGIKDESNAEEVIDAASLGFSVGQDVRDVSVKAKLPSFKIPSVPSIGNFKFKFSERTAFIGAVLVLILIVASFFGWWFLPKAQVTLLFAPQKLQGKEQVKFDTNISSVDLSNLKVPAKTISTTQSAEKTKTVTGTAVVGTSSKGSVTFYNVGGSTVVPAGTILTASGLNYSLDSDVSLASASGAASAATAKGNITASGVGADYNLASGTFFTVGNFSSSLLQAKNDADLSGGSSQEVTAVSKDDLDSLTSDLLTQLTTAGVNNLKSNLSAGSFLVDNTVVATPSAKSFDHQVGEQATTVKLSMTAKVSALTVTRDDMDSLATNIFSNQVPNGFSLTNDQIDFIFESKDVNFMVNLLPNVNKDQIANQISGKSLTSAKSILSKLPGFEDLQVQMKPNIPFLQILPHVAKNISLAVSAK